LKQIIWGYKKLKEIEMNRIKKLARFTQKIETEFLIGKKPMELIQSLKERLVNVVVDIRFWSVFPLYFNPISLRILLTKNNIEYVRFQTLGNPSMLRNQAGNNHELAKELYQNYINSYQKAKDQFLELYKKIRFKKIYCLICYCDTLDPRNCHRFWLREALINAKRINLGFEGNFVLERDIQPIFQEVN